MDRETIIQNALTNYGQYGIILGIVKEDGLQELWCSNFYEQSGSKEDMNN